MTFGRALAAVVLAFGWQSQVAAQDVKYVGTWEGFSQPIYTKLVFHDDGGLTYCAVQNCRAIQCARRTFSGDIRKSFAFSDGLRDWSFDWTGPGEIDALMSVRDGGLAFAVYVPEGPDDRFDLTVLPTPLN